MLCGTRAISARSVGICNGVPSTARSSLNWFNAERFLLTFYYRSSFMLLFSFHFFIKITIKSMKIVNKSYPVNLF